MSGDLGLNYENHIGWKISKKKNETMRQFSFCANTTKEKRREEKNKKQKIK